MIDIKPLLFGLIGAGLLGLVGHLVFDIDLIASIILAAAGILVNGLIALWEDKGKFND